MTNKENVIIWEKWRDPFGELDEDISPSDGLGEFLNDDTDNGNATASLRSKIYVNNGSALSLNILTNTPSTANASQDLTMGASSSGGAKYSYFDGGISQLIIYNTDQSGNRAGITTAINQQFSIY